MKHNTTQSHPLLPPCLMPLPLIPLQDPEGNVFVADSGNAVIRRIDGHSGEGWRS